VICLTKVLPGFFTAETQQGDEIEEGGFLFGDLECLIVTAFGEHAGNLLQALFGVAAPTGVIGCGALDGGTGLEVSQSVLEELDGGGDFFHGVT
jgi:hypothetical protein